MYVGYTGGHLSEDLVDHESLMGHGGGVGWKIEAQALGAGRASGDRQCYYVVCLRQLFVRFVHHQSAESQSTAQPSDLARGNLQ